MHLQTVTTIVEISQTGTTAADYYTCPPLPGEWVCTATWVPHVATGVDGTNYRTLAFTSGATTVFTSIATSAASWAAGTPVALTASVAAGLAAEYTGQTDCLKIALTAAGTGATIRGQVVCAWTRRNQ